MLTNNNPQLIKKNQWKIILEGMLNNHALCQYFVHQLLEIVHNQLLQSLIYYNMDDILLANSDAETLENN